jgi:hypothetical protein
MAITKSQTTVWASEVLANLNPALVFQRVANTDYVGEINGQGSNVKIISIGAITGANYTGADVTFNAVTDAEAVLNIDQKYANGFKLDAVDLAQASVDLLQPSLREMAFDLAKNVDTYIAGLHTEANASNLIGSTAVPTSITTAADAYKYLVQLRTKLSKQNVPMEGRWVVVPPEFVELTLQDDRFVGAAADPTIREAGAIQRAAGFNIFESNTVANTTGTKYKIMAGGSTSITFAGQLQEVEIGKPEKSFGTIGKALLVYGAKVPRDTALAVLTANFA